MARYVSGMSDSAQPAAPVAVWSAGDLVDAELGLAIHEAAFLSGGVARVVAVSLTRLVARGVLERSDARLRLVDDVLRDAPLPAIDVAVARAAHGFTRDAGAALVVQIAADPALRALEDRLIVRGFVQPRRSKTRQLVPLGVGTMAPPVTATLLAVVGAIPLYAAVAIGELGLFGGFAVAALALARPWTRAWRRRNDALQRLRASERNIDVADRALILALQPTKGGAHELALVVNAALP
jgi:uncharacterized protein (TIGR04222 family)